MITDKHQENTGGIPAGTLRFVHLTDTHLMDGPEDTYHGLNTRESLSAVLDDIRSTCPELDFLLFTGDISQTGNSESYYAFKSCIRDIGIPVYAVPGNHDVPEYLQQVIPDCPGNSIQTIDLGDYTLTLLNSRVPGEHYGMVSTRCLEQLDKHLDTSIHRINIIAVHHPPVLINSKWLDELGLVNRDEILDMVCRHPGTTLLLSGHVHQEIDQQMDHVRLLATPSTCYQFKANSDRMQRLETPQPAYRYIELRPGSIHTRVRYIPAPMKTAA